MTVFLPWRSTRLPNQIPLAAVVSRKIPASIPVASTEWVSRNTQNVTANHIVKLMTDTSSVLTNRCTNVRSVLRLKSMARALLDMMWTPVSRFYEFRPLKL
jgi:hypothetical protein